MDNEAYEQLTPARRDELDAIYDGYNTLLWRALKDYEAQKAQAKDDLVQRLKAAGFEEWAWEAAASPAP